MNERPILERGLDANTFKSYYYLKDELVAFCRKNGLQASGGKQQLTHRIAYFLDTGEKLVSVNKRNVPVNICNIARDSIIENDFVCSEKHRAFFRKNLGNSFTFNVLFQKWLKENSGKTYGDAIEAYHKILREKKTKKVPIDKQFEYNTYIRDFFSQNKDKNLSDAIKCWKYKKSISGNNKYDIADLEILSINSIEE
ncbi:MAG TPA: hypothetical protein GX401_00290 [Clostridiales bacterium]|nr:hypothetical protein [Clostridiales bacterium]